MLKVPERPTDNPALLERWLQGSHQRALNPGRAWCTRCGRTCGDRSHTTPYCVAEVGGTCSTNLKMLDEHGNVVPGTDAHVKLDAHAGAFPMCQECWSELTPEERVPFYEILIDHWRSGYAEGSVELAGLAIKAKALLHSVRLGR